MTDQDWMMVSAIVFSSLAGACWSAREMMPHLRLPLGAVSGLACMVTLIAVLRVVFAGNA